MNFNIIICIVVDTESVESWSRARKPAGNTPAAAAPGSEPNSKFTTAVAAAELATSAPAEPVSTADTAAEPAADPAADAAAAPATTAATTVRGKIWHRALCF